MLLNRRNFFSGVIFFSGLGIFSVKSLLGYRRQSNFTVTEPSVKSLGDEYVSINGWVVSKKDLLEKELTSVI